ncbi:AraC family transcriptional regulator [Massilia glaciei]|uniref:AraC family transcriptional regulator n=1 Tax=Massilia glaciei TaxID=1524097 RepID=A0A2U2I6P3_9BURK|nr:AraC family transcriptional regulator [Massilia glaciei]PWF55428.1 AraC family transcriptional regulator [Massilia glaciei]
MATPARPNFHPTYAKLLHALLLGQGHDADALLARVGLSAALLRDNDRMVDAARMRDLIVLAVEATRCPSIGLDFGLMAQVSMHGPVGYAAAASATLGQAVEAVTRFIGLRSTAFRLDLHAGRARTELVVVELADMGVARQVLLEAVVKILARLLQSLAGRACPEVRYGLPWAAPAWSARYADCLGGTCRFDAARLSLTMPAGLLDSACMSSDAGAHAAAREDCERRLALAPSGNSVSELVRARLRRCDGNYPTLATLAAEHARSPRTLMRQLKADGCCYQALLDEVRYERARWCLRHTEASMEIIAARLGLQDTSNFSRCFRRWSGGTPSEFRRTAGRPPQAVAPSA